MSPRLADIGVTGFQKDVVDGGDVDPDTGRLLTIAEMQQALRIVRQRPLTASHPTAAVAEPGPVDPGSSDLGSAGPGWSDPVDQDRSDADPFGWDTGRDWEVYPDGEALSEPTATPAAGRPGRERTDDVEIGPVHHRAPIRLLRRALGMDRTSRTARRGGDDWLPQPTTTGSAGTAAPVIAEPSADAPVPTGRRARRARKAASTPETAGTAASADFEVAAAPRGFTAVFWRWIARLLLLVLVLAGLNAVFVRPFRDTATTAPAVSGVDAAAAAALAARFTADYLSYVSTAPAGNTAALTAQLAGTAGVSQLTFTGTGYVRADLVQTGQVGHVDDTHAMVAVTARLRLATPPAGDGQPGGAATTAPAAAAADPGPVPAGWTDLGSRWVALVVPVETTPTGLRVSAAGPVFSTEPPGQVVVPAATTGIDADTVAATHDVAVAFFTGYAASNVAYLAAPGVSMGGLGGAVTLSSVDSWSIAVPTDGTDSPTDSSSVTSGVGSGSVVWLLAGTELSVVQQYTVAMTHAEGRWYAAALSPTRTASP